MRIRRVDITPYNWLWHQNYSRWHSRKYPYYNKWGPFGRQGKGGEIISGGIVLNAPNDRTPLTNAPGSSAEDTTVC